MPVGTDNIGRSSNTPVKWETMRAFWAAWCSLVNMACRKRKRPVRYIDLTAGNGERNSFVSSVRQIAFNCGLDIEMYCFERDPANARKLSSRVDIEFVCDDEWQNRTGQIVGLTKNSYCFIYHDANHQYAREHRVLAQLVSFCQYADFTVHLDANQIKRCRRAGVDFFDIRDLLLKRTCIIRDPHGNGSQWSILHMTNGPPITYKKFGFHNVNTKHGQSVLAKLCFTKEEYAKWLDQNSGQLML